MQLVVGGMDTIAAEMVMEFERLAAAGPLACGLTGGGAGMIILGALRTARVDWSRVSLFWTDERAVPPTHTDSGVGLVHRMLIARLKGQPGPRLFPMPATEPDLEHAAAEYDAQLAEALGGDGLDLAIVGIGEDGHVAGLFPRHAALAATSRVVAVADAPARPCAASRFRCRFSSAAIVSGSSPWDRASCRWCRPPSGGPAARRRSISSPGRRAT
ncbi:MAG: 6-phosphogluconolactonase [Vicinamibacterales bacterium]